MGETFVQGQDQATARDLLDAAEQLGLHPGSVRAVRGGFIVPNDVWDHMQENRADQAGF